MFRRVSGFIRGDEGAVAPLYAIAIIALVGMGALAWDVSRAFALRAELDAAVDAAALAGATQLDGSPGSIGRATAAAQGAFVKNRQRLADDSEPNVTIATSDIKFPTSLGSPRTFLDKSATTSDAAATFIQIDLAPRDLSLIMGVFARSTGFKVTAHAVAGYGSGLCKIPPLMVCNPNEPVGNVDRTLVFNADNYTGYGLTMKGAPGGSTAWAPGAFGYLSVGGNLDAIKDAMARNPPSTECYGSVVTAKDGQNSSVLDYFNVRFDIYASGLPSNWVNESAYAPAQNTVTGLDRTSTSGSSECKPDYSGRNDEKYDGTVTDDVVAMSLPMDTCAYPVGSGSCQIGLGNGAWDSTGYFSVVHHPITTIDPTTAPTGETWASFGPVPSSSVTKPTRYQVYQWELKHRDSSGSWTTGAMAANAGAGVNASSGTDFVSPQCSSLDVVSTPDRRTTSVVVVNCRAEMAYHSKNNLNGLELKVAGGVDVFLTQPAFTRGGENFITGEIIGKTSDISTVGKETRLYSVRLYE